MVSNVSSWPSSSLITGNGSIPINAHALWSHNIRNVAKCTSKVDGSTCKDRLLCTLCLCLNAKIDSRVSMTISEDDSIPKATRQHPLSVPAKGCNHRQQGGGQFSLHSGGGVLV